MSVVVNNMRAIRGPVTAVPMVGVSGIILEADTENNRVVVRPDETILWEGTPTNSGTVTLSESIGNFDRVLLYWTKTVDDNNAGNVDIISTVRGVYNFMHHIGTSNAWVQMLRLDYNDTSRQLTFAAGKNMNFGAYSATTWSNPSVSSGIGDSFNLYKVVGINRIAG